MKKQLLLFTFAFGLFTFSLAQQGTIQLPATGQTTSYHTGDDGDLQNGIAWPEERYTDHEDGTATDKLTDLMWATEGNILATRNPDFDQDYVVGDGSVNWTTALDYIAELNQENYLGYNDWRLPNIMELMSMLDLGVPDTALSVNHPFTNLQQSYWSSTTGYDKGIAFAITVFEWEIHSNSKYQPGQVMWYSKILSGDYYADNRKVYVLPVRGEHGSGLIELPRTTQEKSYYPGDDLDQSMGVQWPTPRFFDYNDSTITDRLTDLMWTQNADPLAMFGFGWGDEITWTQAFAYLDSLNNRNYCGHNDWRLPNRHEMLSLRDFGGEYLYTYLPENNPFTYPGGRYWTSTTSASSTEKVHAVNITLIDVTLELLKEDPTFARIWPVRTDNIPPSPGSIQGKIMHQGNPLKDVKLSLEGPVNATVSTDANGDYYMSALPPGSYSITPSKFYYSFNPETITVNLTTQNEIRDFSAVLTATHGWQNLRANLPESFSIRDMHFIGQEGWLAGGRDKVYYTPDGGLSFQIQYLPESSGISSSVFMKSNTEGYVVTGNGHILKTEDGGSNWYLLHAPGNVLNSVHFPPNSDTGFTCGTGGTVWSFDDTSITDISTPTVSHLKSICFPESINEGKVLGEVYIGRYKDNAWNNLQFYDSTLPRVSIFFIDNNTGWAVGGYGTINYTTDGIQWLVGQTSTGTYDDDLHDVFFINSSEGWIVGVGIIWHSDNGGINWTDDAPGFADGMGLTSVYFISAEEGYAAGNNEFLKYGSLTGIEDEWTDITAKTHLRQNAPNPFNDDTKIEYDLPDNDWVTIKVFNITGQEIATLVNAHQNRGQHSVEFKRQNLPEGVYFYRLVSGQINECKPMIKVK
jgi:photosystem II stability/assembly factor-like uncharacterized protein